MDIWFNVIATTLESPDFEFSNEFVGGKLVVRKDFWENDETTTAGWLVNVFFRPLEFKDRPIVADLCIRYGNQRRELLSVLLKNDSFFGHIRTRQKTGRLLIAARLRKMLCELDLKKPSGSRQFVIQNFDARLKDSILYYVSTVKLSQLEGDLFKKWKAQEASGVMTINEHLEGDLMEALMETTAKYDDIVIMRHNFDKLIKVAKRFRMHKLMRAIEEHLTETKLLSWDQKILLALQYRMGPLYVQVQRKYLVSPWTILCRVQRLLIKTYFKPGDEQNADPYEMMHKHLLELVMLSEENICIG